MYQRTAPRFDVGRLRTAEFIGAPSVVSYTCGDEALVQNTTTRYLSDQVTQAPYDLCLKRSPLGYSFRESFRGP